MCPRPLTQISSVSIDDIDKLNSIVRSKVVKFVSDAKDNETTLSPEISAVLSGKVIVYQKRFTILPYFWTAFSLFLILSQYEQPLNIAIAGTIMFLWYDFFSGILHVVLDNPDFINLPLLGPPCLEFQWHHHIPKDLASKSFAQTCGDLNVVVFILCAIYLVLFRINSSIGLSLVGFKLLMAYFGQLCHCMAHTAPNDRPFWVKSCQNMGLMISPIEHGIHHQTYDKNFCIGSGLCNPIITWGLDNITDNKWCWLVAFLLCSSMDVPLFNYLLTTQANFN